MNKKRVPVLAITLAFTGATCLANVSLVRTSNVVGYCDIDVAPGLNIIGTSFQDIGATNATVNIQNVVTSSSFVGIDWSDFSEGDSIQIWSPTVNAYVEYYFWAGSSNTTSILGYDVSNQWIDETSMEPANKSFKVGSGFWLYSNFPTNIICTISGEVPSGNAGCIAFPQGTNMLGNPYPAEVSITNVSTTGLTTEDCIRFWRGASYETIYYYGVDDGIYPDDSYNVNLGPGWGDYDQIAVTNTIKPGEGFWLNSESSGSISFPRPVTP